MDSANPFGPSAPPAYSDVVPGTSPNVLQNNTTVIVQQSGSTPANTEQATGNFQHRSVQGTTDNRSYLQRFKDFCDNLYQAGKALWEYAIDLAQYADTVITRAAQGFAYGAGVGIVAGIGMTALCPYLATGAFAVSITACSVAGTILGGITGHQEGTDDFNLARGIRASLAEVQPQMT